jgi:23S rRNA (adenine2030-N6)-methyltransferase
MNYRHAFHAGNFADVHKHAVLVRILEYLRQKPGGFRVIDSHAGAGRYDLYAAEPSRSGEWRDGIARVWQKRAEADAKVSELLAPYVAAVAACNTDGDLRIYPGSPLIAQKMLRGQDRLVACEIEPSSAAALAGLLRGDRRAKAITIDGWTAIPAYVPPKERRGLVLIDPPFEDANDFTHLSEALSAAHRKWPAGITMLWYPIKTREGPDALARRLRRAGIASILRCEMMLRPPHADAGLAGSGLILVNPPYTLEQELQILLPGLIRMMAPQAEQASGRLDWLAPNL